MPSYRYWIVWSCHRYDKSSSLVTPNISVDGDILMAIPELYRYGREHYWYGTKIFIYFLFEAVYQVSKLKDNQVFLADIAISLSSFISSFCMRTSPQPHDRTGMMLHFTNFLQYEGSFLCYMIDWIINQVMALSAVMSANLFNGLNTTAWTGWVFFAVLIGILLVWLYTVSTYRVILFSSHLIVC